MGITIDVLCILQGLNKPVSDLSRGANEEDVYKLSIITAAKH